MNKRGSHVGVILSFAIFITFMVFLYFIIEPAIRIQGDKQNILDNLERELLEKFFGNLTTFTLINEIEITEDCVELEKLMDKKGMDDSRIIVKNESGAILNVKRDKKNLFVDTNNKKSFFLKIYHSEEFDEIEEGDMSGCEKLNQNKYSIESVKQKEEIFLTRINKTKEEYEENYTSLKNELNIPDGSEFGFMFTDKDEIIIETEKKDVSRSVYAEEIPVLFVNREVNIKPGFMNIRVW